MGVEVHNTEEEVDQFLEILPKAIEATKAETESRNSGKMVVRMIEPEY